MKAHKRLIISIISIMFLLLSIIPSLQLYLNSADGHAYIRRKFNEALPGKFLGTVNFKQARLAMFSGFLSFDSLTVFDSANAQFATIPLAVAKFTVLDLLKPHTTIDSLIFIAPKCSVSAGQIGKIWNLNQDSLPPVKPDMVINSFIVRYGNFSYRDVKKDLTLISRCREIYSEFDFPANYFFLHLKNAVTDFHYTFLNKTVQTGFLTAKIMNNRLFLSDGKLSCQGVDLELGGSVDNLFSDPYFHLKIQTSIDSRKFMGHISTFKSDAGYVNTSLQLNGTLRFPDFHATLTHSGGVLAGVKLDSLLADISYINNYLTIKKAALVSQSGKIQIYGLIDFHRVFAGRLFMQNPDYNAVQYSVRADGDDVLRLFTKDSLFSLLPLKGSINWRGSGLIPQFMNGEIKTELYTQATDTNSAGIAHFLKVKSYLQLSAGKVKLVNGEIEHNGTVLKGTGGYNLFTGLLDFRFAGSASLLPPERIFGFNRYKAILGIRGNYLKPELYGSLIKANGAQKGTIDNLSFLASLQPNGYLKIRQAGMDGEDAKCKVSGFITAPYFFGNKYTKADLKTEVSVSDLSVWWPELQMKGALFTSLNLKKNNAAISLNCNIGAAGLNLEGYRSSLVAESALKGEWGRLSGDFKADLTRNQNAPANIVKISGIISDSTLFVQNITLPTIENRRHTVRNQQLEHNFIDQLIQKLNGATEGKFILHNK